MSNRVGVLDPLTQFGMGSLERDRTYLVYGESGTGKTLLCLLAALSFAKQEKDVLFASTDNISVVNRLSTIANSHLIDRSVLDKILIFQVKTQRDEEKITEIAEKTAISLVIYDSATHIYSLYISENSKLVIHRNKLFTNFLAYMHSIRKKRHLSLIYTSNVSGTKDKALAHNALTYFTDWRIRLLKRDMMQQKKNASYLESDGTQHRYSYTIDNLGFATGELV
jgi:RecA/RadA recombinase